MMKKGFLSQELRTIRDENPDTQPRAVFISSYSLNPPKLMRILRNDLGLDAAAMKRTFVYFQRYSFRQMNAAYNEPPYRGARRREKIDEFEGERKYRAFRVRSKRPVTRQLHLKSIFTWYDNKIEFLQFSRNLDLRAGDESELMYRGLPRRLSSLMQLLRDILDQGQGYVENMNPPAILVTAKDRLGEMIDYYNTLEHDANSHMVIQGFDAFFAHQVKGVLTEARDSENASLYKQWVTRDTNSVLLLHFPYVSNGLEMDMCSTVVDPMSLSDEEREKTTVELAYSATMNLSNFHHESWICRLTGKGPDKRVLYFFIVSNNLTLPSWMPFLNQMADQRNTRYNLECGVFMLEKLNPAETLFSQALMDHITQRMEPGNTTTLSSAKCKFDRTTVVEDAQLEVSEVPCRRRGGGCREVYDSASTNGARLENAKNCLKHGYLTGLVGAQNLLESNVLKSSFFMRWALYDYLFNDLARQHPVGRLGVYDMDMTRKYFIREILEYPDSHPWAKCKTARVTLDVLVDIFTRWSKAFDMYDSRINATKPLVNNDTLVTLDEARCQEQIVEDANHKYREDCTAYDTLSFLIQSMHSSSSVWWQCPRGHTFYWTPKNMLMHSTSCQVCAKYHDIREIYDYLKLQPDVSCLTVEFPLIINIVTPGAVAEGGDDDDDAEEENDAQGEGVIMDARRSMMRYDVFFRYKERYLCAIEFDDVSHNNKAQGIEQINVNNPPADAKKNVLSSAMGIHLMRVWAGATEKRPNAKSRIGLLVRTFLNLVENNDVQMPADKDAFANRIGRFELAAGWAPIALLTRLGRQADGRLKSAADKPNEKVGKIPVSIVFDTRIPPNSYMEEEYTLLTSMETAGRNGHPCLKNKAGTNNPLYKIKVQEFIDAPSRKAYFTYLSEWMDTQGALNEDFLTEENRPRGRLIPLKDFKKKNLAGSGLMMVSSAQEGDNITRLNGYVLESKKVLPFEMPTRDIQNPSGLEQIKSIAKQFVRIKPKGAPRIPEEKCPYPDMEEAEWAGAKAKDVPVTDAVPPRKGWPEGAFWALPGNRIRYMNPNRQGDNWESLNPPHGRGADKFQYSQSFEDRRVLSAGLEITGGVYDFWISVENEKGHKVWIEREAFQYVTRPSVVRDRTPLSSYEFVMRRRV